MDDTKTSYGVKAYFLLNGCVNPASQLPLVANASFMQHLTE